MKITAYEESLRSTVRLARLSFTSAAASVFTYDEARNVLVFEAASGAGEDTIIGVEVPADQGIVGWVASTGEPILLREVASDSRFSMETAAGTGYIPDTIMAMPLIHQGEIIGVMEVLDPKLDRIDDIAALDLLAELASQAAMLLSLLPRGVDNSSIQRARAAVEFEELLARVPDKKLNEVSQLMAAIALIVT